MSQELEFMRRVLRTEEAFREFCALLRENVVSDARDLLEYLACEKYEQAAGRIHSLRGLFRSAGYEEGARWCDQVGQRAAEGRIMVAKDELDAHVDAALKRIARIVEGSAN